MTKTLLQILPALDQSGGGVERGTLDIAKTVIDHGYNSVIISSGGDMAEKYKYKGVSHHEIKLNKKGFLNFLSSRKQFKKILDELNPNIIHIRSRWPSFCFSNIIKKKRIPLVTTYHGTYSGNNFFLKRNYNKLMTIGDKVISISKFIDDHIRLFFPDCKNRLVNINRGIDTSYFNIDSVSQTRKENFLSSLSIAENTHIILLPGRITSWKGHEIAIDAAKIISKKKPNLNFLFIFVGSAQDRNSFIKKLEKKISNAKLGNRFSFCGHLMDMPAVYSTADIVLSTSIEPEAFGRVSAEASSMTKPVIASNHGGSREIIENNITGWLVEPGNPELLADKIIHVLDLPQNKKDLVGKNARKRVVEKFSLQQMLSKTLSVYEELIEKHKKNSDN